MFASGCPAYKDLSGLVPVAIKWSSSSRDMKTRTHFAHRMLDAKGEVREHLAGVEDYEVAEATWLAAVARWPKAHIILRQGARVVRDSKRPRLVK
jgi:hypothetical protein